MFYKGVETSEVGSYIVKVIVLKMMVAKIKFSNQGFFMIKRHKYCKTLKKFIK